MMQKPAPYAVHSGPSDTGINVSQPTTPLSAPTTNTANPTDTGTAANPDAATTDLMSMMYSDNKKWDLSASETLSYSYFDGAVGYNYAVNPEMDTLQPPFANCK